MSQTQAGILPDETVGAGTVVEISGWLHFRQMVAASGFASVQCGQ